MSGQEQQEATVSQGPTAGQAIPEFYTNSVSISVGAWDLVLDFGLRGPGSGDAVPVFRQRMSIQHAWVMCKLLDRLLTRYIADNGPITLPKSLVEELELSEEYKSQLEARRGNGDR